MTLQMLSWLEGSQAVTAPALGWVLRATLLLAVAGLASAGLNRRSAALRHLVWTTAFGGVLLLPVLGAVLPAWQTPAIALPRAWTDIAVPSAPGPQVVAARNPASGSATPDPAVSKLATQSPCDKNSSTCEGAVGEGPGTFDRIAASAAGTPADVIPPAALPALGLAVWALGSLITLTWFVAGHVTVRRLARATLPAAGESWHRLAEEAARGIGFTRACELRVSHLTLMPMTWGVLRPRVMMPACAESWPFECRKLVLMHELAHVERRDSLTQALAQLICVLLWFHPVVWFAARRMRIERERACDDRVLAADTLASTYAEHLLAVVRSLRAPRLASAGAVSFAHVSQIEGRLLAVLHPGVDRRRVNRAVVGRVLAMAALLAFPLAALEPATAGSIAKQRARAAQTTNVVRPADEHAPLAERVEWARTAAIASRRPGYWVGYSIEPAARFSDGVLGDTYDVDFATLEDSYPGPRLDEVLATDPGQRDAGEAGPIAILLHMAGKQFEVDRVRFQSFRIAAVLGHDPLYWVGAARDPESLALLGRLRSSTRDADIAVRLLETAALHGNSQLVVPELRRALERGSDALRAQAAEGLAQHGKRECVELLVHAARHDPAQVVRLRATEALGSIDAPGALDALVELARSSDDEGVRSTAVEGVAQVLANDATPAPIPIAPVPAEVAAPPSTPAPVANPEPRSTPAPVANPAPVVEQPEIVAPPRLPWSPLTPVVPFTRPRRLPDDAVELQRQAVESLGGLPEDESLPQLLTILEEHPNRVVRLQAVESIANVGSSAAMSLIRKFAWQHADEAVRIEAVQALSRHVPASRALSQLSEIAEMHPDDVTRQQAVESIGQLETPGAVQVLKSTIESDPSDAVQRQAVESLGKRSDPGVLDYLAETARSHPSRRVRSAAVDAIGRLDTAEAAAVLDALVKQKDKKDKF